MSCFKLLILYVQGMLRFQECVENDLIGYFRIFFEGRGGCTQARSTPPRRNLKMQFYLASTVRSTVHTNPLRNIAFRKRFTNRRNLKIASFAF